MSNFRKFRRGLKVAEAPAAIVAAPPPPSGKPGVLLAIPTEDGNVRWTIARMIADAMRYNTVPDHPYEYSYIFLANCKPIDFARNQITEFFLTKTNSDWLVMVDADQEVPDNWPGLLFVSDADVVSGTTYCWVPNEYKEGRLRVNQYGLNEKAQCFNITPPATNGQPYRVPVVGTGCIAIRRKVLEAIPKPHFKFEYYPDGRLLRGEDVHFSTACLQRNLVIAAHPQVRFGHVKPVDLAHIGEYAEAYHEFANSGRQHDPAKVLSI